MAEQTATLAPLVADIVRKYDEPDWLRTYREQAYETFTGMDAPRLEKTDLRKRSFDIGPFSNLTEGGSSRVRGLLNGLKGRAVVFVRDGVVVQTYVPDTLVALGVVVTDLHTAVKNHGDMVQKHLGTVVKADESKWAALNAAVWAAGVFVYVPRNVVVEESVVFVNESSSAARGAAVRSLIVVEEGASVAYTEVFLVDGTLQSGVAHANVLEVVVAASATVKVATANEFTKGPTHFITKRASLGNDAHIDWVFSDAGDGFTVALMETALNGNGSRATFTGIGIGRGRQHMELTASMLHRGRSSESDIRLNGALRDRANMIYRSATHIFRKAVLAGSEQNDRMVMLDSAARADAIPMLLIDENDVQRCGHAASVGRLDEAQMYYLQSRGIPRNTARQMIVWGHLEPTVDAIPDDVVREFVRQQIDEGLAQ